MTRTVGELGDARFGARRSKEEGSPSEEAAESLHRRRAAELAGDVWVLRFSCCLLKTQPPL